MFLAPSSLNWDSVTAGSFAAEKNYSHFTTPEGWASCLMRLQHNLYVVGSVCRPYTSLLYCLGGVFSFTLSLFLYHALGISVRLVGKGMVNGAWLQRAALVEYLHLNPHVCSN